MKNKTLENKKKLINRGTDCIKDVIKAYWTQYEQGFSIDNIDLVLEKTKSLEIIDELCRLQIIIDSIWRAVEVYAELDETIDYLNSMD